MEKERLREEVVHVVSMDIVSFSTKSMEAQVECIQALKSLLNRFLVDCDERPLILDTGDGSILVFSGSISPAIEVARKMVHCGLVMRIGIHTGQITKLEDANGHLNAYGPGINTCQRIMSAAESGGILVSRTSAEFLMAYEKIRDQLVDLGVIVAKHGERIYVFGISGLPGIAIENLKVGHHFGPSFNHNLGHLSLPFVGRSSERSRLKELLLDERRRLVTIAGPGGIGKTTLANYVGKSLCQDFSDGVWLVDCDELSNSEDIAASLANSMSLGQEGRSPGGIREILADHQCLIILDCLEKLPNILPFIEDLLTFCSELQILATSRVLLTSKWETEFFIGPLGLKRDENGKVDAELLFIEAVRQVNPSFQINKGNRALVESIVQSVQGMPLAIVLAAGRLKYVSLFELKSQLDGRKIDVLRRRTTSNDRHANLSNVVAESFDLLDSEAREVLIELTVFSGGFFLKDAERILGEELHIQDSIEVLRDNSLLVGTIVGKKMRYRSLDVVAEFVESQAQNFSLHSLHLKHAHYFSDLAEVVRHKFDEGHWSTESEILWSDLGNFRKAINFALVNQSSELLSQFAQSLARIFMEAGLRSDFETLATSAVEAESLSVSLRLELQGLLGGIYRREDNRELAEKYWLLRAEGLMTHADIDTQADAWMDLACIALHYDDDRAAATYIAKFDSLAKDITSQQVLAVGAIASGILHAKKQDIECATVCARKAESLLLTIPRDTRALFTFSFLSELYIRLGESDSVLELCRWGIPEAIEGKHPSYAGHLLVSLSQALRLSGNIQGAVLALCAAEKIPKSVSQTLRSRIIRFKSEMVHELGEEPFLEAERRAIGSNWQELANSCAKWYNPTWMG